MGIPETKKEKVRRKKLDKYFIFIDPDPSDRAVVEFLSLIDIFVYASVQGETFGMSIAEAMAAKKPVVVKSTPMVDNAQIELVDNGRTGFVVYTPEAFAEAVARLASNRKIAKKMGLAGYEKAKREFEAEKTTRMVERRILELLSEKGFDIPKGILNSYKNISKFPTVKDINDFDLEYERRLRDVMGKPDLIRIFIGKHISFSSTMQRFIRGIKLTNLRNMIRKLVLK
jgi:predicted aspartyl protease